MRRSIAALPLLAALLTAWSLPGSAQPGGGGGFDADSLPLPPDTRDGAAEGAGPFSGGAEFAALGADPAAPTEPAGPARSPDVLRDAGLLTVGATGYAFVRNKHRGRILRRGSFDNILENFRHPIRRALDSVDDDSFLTNYVAHPLTWGGIALYLKREGYSDLGALALSQAHSVYWEYVVEGSYVLPSGRDMVTNFVSAAFVIYGLPRVTGDLFPQPDESGPATRTEDGPSLSLAPPVVDGPYGPTLQLGLRIR